MKRNFKYLHSSSNRVSSKLLSKFDILKESSNSCLPKTLNGDINKLLKLFTYETN